MMLFLDTSLNTWRMHFIQLTVSPARQTSVVATLLVADGVLRHCWTESCWCYCLRSKVSPSCWIRCSLPWKRINATNQTKPEWWLFATQSFTWGKRTNPAATCLVYRHTVLQEMLQVRSTWLSQPNFLSVSSPDSLWCESFSSFVQYVTRLFLRSSNLAGLLLHPRSARHSGPPPQEVASWCDTRLISRTFQRWHWLVGLWVLGAEHVRLYGRILGAIENTRISGIDSSTQTIFWCSYSKQDREGCMTERNKKINKIIVLSRRWGEETTAYFKPLSQGVQSLFRHCHTKLFVCVQYVRRRP